MNWNALRRALRALLHPLIVAVLVVSLLPLGLSTADAQGSSGRDLSDLGAFRVAGSGAVGQQGRADGPLSQLASVPAALAGWAYRQEVTIGNSGGSLSNYQLKLSLNSANFDFSKPQPAGQDLRFTDADGATLLDYWVEGYDAAAQVANVWVKVPAIAASSNKTIYLYYGNPQAPSVSNGAATFEFFDDFDYATPVTFGFITDIHHSLYPSSGWGGDYTARMTAFAAAMRSAGADFILADGDNVHNEDDSGVLPAASLLNNVDSAKQALTTFGGRTYYALGNHDMIAAPKSDVIAHLNQPAIYSYMPYGYYFFDYPAQHLRFVVLDSQYNTDGTDKGVGDAPYTNGYIPPVEKAWLSSTLAEAANLNYKVVLFNHQSTEGTSSGISNAAEISAVVENSGVVFLVLEGHTHWNSNPPVVRNGVTYIHTYSPVGNSSDTTPNNDWALVRVYSGGQFLVSGSGGMATFSGAMDTLLPAWTVDSGPYALQNGALYTMGSGTVLHTKNYIDQGDTVVVAKMTKWAGSTGSNEPKIMRQFADTNNYSQLKLRWDYDDYTVSSTASGVSTTLVGSASYALADSVWETAQFGWSGSTVRAKVGSDAWHSGIAAFTAGRAIGLRNHGTDLRVDYIFVRRYAASEPSFSLGIIEPTGQVLVALDDLYSVHQNTVLNVPAPGVLANDSGTGGTLTAVLVSGPSRGSLSLASDGSFSYIPNFAFVGLDSFSYEAYDGVAYSNVATVAIQVGQPTPMSTPTLTYTPTPTYSPTPTITPPPPASSAFTLYSDALAPGWRSGSWGATVNLASTAYVHSGSYAVSFTMTGAYGAFAPSTRSGSFDLTPFTNVRFYVNGEATGGQKLSFMVYRTDTGVWSKLVAIDKYIAGGGVAAGQWRLMDMPLSALGIGGVPINRIALQSSLSTPQPAVSVDDIEFYNASVPATATPTNTPLPTDTPTNTPVPTSTPVPTYTPTSTPVATDTPTYTPTATFTPTFIYTPAATFTPTFTFTPTPTPGATTPTATPTFTPGPVATPTSAPTPTPGGTSSALLLYYSTKTPSDSGFEKIIRYYGLGRRDVDLATTALTDGVLRDSSGRYYSTAYVDGANIDQSLDTTELATLRHAVEAGGLNLLVSDLRTGNSPAIQALTGSEIGGSRAVSDSAKDYLVSTVDPAVTRQFTGLTITYPAAQNDYALTIAPGGSHTLVLVQSTDNNLQTYPLFVVYQHGLGRVFAASNAVDMVLQWNNLAYIYSATANGNNFCQQWFSEVVPTMMFVRAAAGDKVWHNDHHYVNFTLDDPSLRADVFDYAGVLQQAIDHNFHLTVALVPSRYDDTDQSVVDLFLGNPGRLSLVQHGNNHDGYEFYKYTVDASDPYPARPLADQEADIVEGRARMQALSARTGIPYAPVMVFPFNISPADTLTLLKQYNYQSTINSLDFPLGSSRSWAWDSYVYPAEMEYNNFAVIKRYGPDTVPYPFELFLDRPAFLYGHPDLFSNRGIGALNPIADSINSINGGVEWRSIDYIMKRLYLEKTNDDGTVEVMFYGNEVVVANETDANRVYHLKRSETLNVPISGVFVDDQPAGYVVSAGTLQVDFVIPARGSRDLKIVYGTGP